MGKQRRQRRKFHAEAQNPAKTYETSDFLHINPSPLIVPPSDNVFAGIQINVGSLNKNLADDVKSVKSIKSLVETDKPLPKKERRALRKKLLLKKLDAANELKKESKERAKRKSAPIIGDTKDLHDALSSLESLLKNKEKIAAKSKPTKTKGIEKSTKQRKNVLQGINIFKQIYKNKTFEKNPMETIADQVKNIVGYEKQNVKK